VSVRAYFVAVHYTDRRTGEHRVRPVQHRSRLGPCLQWAVDHSEPDGRVAVEVGLGEDGEIHPLDADAQSVRLMLEGMGGGA